MQMKIAIFLGMDNGQMLKAWDKFIVDTKAKGIRWPEVSSNNEAIPAVVNANYADSVIQDFIESKEFFAIITHSEDFFNRFRLRVAEGKLSKENVEIHWVKDDMVEIINIDNHGGLTTWPRGLFDNQSNELYNIIKSRKKK
jgi:hypothetical protein